ncbi:MULTISPECIES: hypothetical protein [unclassified Xanthobacter]|uniref:hypothetical protein n=2 Tax=unclassified Xanthobacter TaxID=2623496 RepID=UPI001F37E59A|nr:MULTISPECIES: hypothetical protein [unclassified Xanthobacter]
MMLVAPCQADHGATFVLCDENGAILLRTLGNTPEDKAHAVCAANAINTRAPLIEALRAILTGSEASGRWLDPAGAECDQAAPGAEWAPYTGEEQDIWISSVADIAREAIRSAGETPAP